jgi:hypothetical protein
MIDTNHLNPIQWPTPLEMGKNSHQLRKESWKLRKWTAEQIEKQKKEQELITKFLQHTQQYHKTMRLLLDNGSNIPHTTIRICAKYGQKGHWGILCPNPDSGIPKEKGKCTFCKGHHQANLCKQRRKMMAGSGHVNVQYVKDTMGLEENPKDHMHPDLVVANWL